MNKPFSGDEMACDTEISFLSDDFLKEANAVLQLPDEILTAFYKAFSLIRESPELRSLAVDYHQMLYGSEYPDDNGEIEWPIPDLLRSLMGELSGMFKAAIVISGLPRTVQWYESKGIPHNILVDTMSDVEVWMRNYYNKEGEWGLKEATWLQLHLHSKLFRLGRLQFVLDPFYYNIHVYQNTDTAEIIAFPAAGTAFRRDGLIDGSDDVFDREEGWISSFEITDAEIIGNPISRDGYGDRATVALPKDRWRQVLVEKDPVLHVHIAEGSKMTYELCRESYLRALAFYPKYFPGQDFKAFSCGSWLLSPQFREILPAASNIVKFQRDYYLFPILSREEFMLSRVFGQKQIDPATAPRDTSLRAAILEYMAKGNRMVSAGGFILREDVESRWQT